MTKIEHDIIISIFGEKPCIVLDRIGNKEEDLKNNFAIQKNLWRKWFLDGSFTLAAMFTLQLTPAMLKKKFASYENFVEYKPLKWSGEFMGVWW